jgi:hypothetical protein
MAYAGLVKLVFFLILHVLIVYSLSNSIHYEKRLLLDCFAAYKRIKHGADHPEYYGW